MFWNMIKFFKNKYDCLKISEVEIRCLQHVCTEEILTLQYLISMKRISKITS